MTENSKNYSLKIMIYEFVRKSELGYSRKKPNKGVKARTWNFTGCWKKSIEVEFQSVFTKKPVEFPWSGVFDLGISNGYHYATQFFRISRDKATNVKILEFFFSEKYILNPLLLDFFWNCPLALGNLLPHQVPLL